MDKIKNNSTWIEQSDYFEKNSYWLSKSKKLALKILKHLKKENISQKTLAERLQVKPQQVNKIVNGGANNMTFQTICKLEIELGIELIKIPEATRWDKFDAVEEAERYMDVAYVIENATENPPVKETKILHLFKKNRGGFVTGKELVMKEPDLELIEM